ncbi:uncharacterized protein BDZ99DRAFT_289989 [Mytilinidion resinicola]|uniref:Uncharacterized protein n=1 Tax=Mytilinidion resinicola TaxID=574789 RepID=A0A6A6YS21_9PEZI|nr:uncharacterized protein BDZ99DRAFT_289989 [Mytilinidion resinicola]KAF2810844.1 hypothetical protein BDZ99DRAFT_289989 [Mytilinidion resinicola]
MAGKKKQKEESKEESEETSWRVSQLLERLETDLKDKMTEGAFRLFYTSIVNLGADDDARVSISQWNSLYRSAERVARLISDRDTNAEMADEQKTTNPQVFHPPHDLEPKAWVDYKGRIFRSYGAEKDLAEVVLHIAKLQGFEQATNNTKTDRILAKCPDRLRCFFLIEGFYRTGEHLVGFLLPPLDHLRTLDFDTAIAKAEVFIAPCADLELTLAKFAGRGWQPVPNVDDIMENATDEEEDDSDATEEEGEYDADVESEGDPVSIEEITIGVSANIFRVLNGKHQKYFESREGAGGLPLYTLVQLHPDDSLYSGSEASTPKTNYRARPTGPAPDPDAIRRSKLKPGQIGRIQREINSCSNSRLEVGPEQSIEEQFLARRFFLTAKKWVKNEHRRNKDRGCERRWL